MGTLYGFKWPDVAARLRLHGLWDADIETGLSICESEMMTIAAEEAIPRKEGNGNA